MATGFFQRLANLSEVIPDDEDAPSIFNTGIFTFGQSAGATDTDPRPTSSGSAGSTSNAAAVPPSGGGGGGNGSPSVSHGGAPNPAPTSEELALVRRQATDLSAQLADRTTRYKALLDEATEVKAELDAYRRKAEAEARAQRQQAQEDRRMLEELRTAGGGGTVDEVYVAGLRVKAEEAQRQLRAALAETQTAVRRQREAEEHRKLTEAEKKEEVAGLVARYEQLLGRAERRRALLEAELTEERGRRRRDGHETDTKVGNGTLGAIDPVAVIVSSLSCSSVDGADGTAAAAAAGPPPPAATAATAQTLERRLAPLRARVAELEKEAALAEERSRRVQGEAAADAQETQRRLAEKTTELDEARSRHAALQSSLAAAEDAHGARERDLLFRARQLEDTVARVTRKKQDLSQAAEATRLGLAEALQVEREKASRNSQRVDAAAIASQEVNAALEAQRAHYSAVVAARDATIAELSAVRRALEQAEQDAREDARQQADRIEQLRRELGQQAASLGEQEARQLHGQRLLALREEELQAREAERQRLRAVLRDEEDAYGAVRQELAEAVARAADLQQQLAEREAAAVAAAADGSARDAEARQEAARCEALTRAVADREAEIVPLESQLAELRGANVRLREEVARQHEAHARELQARPERGPGFGPASSRHAVLAAAVAAKEDPTGGGGVPPPPQQQHPFSSPAGAGAADAGAFKYVPPPTNRERRLFMQDAVQSAQRLASQARNQKFRLAVAVVAVAVVAMMILSGFMTASTTNRGGKEHKVLLAELRACQIRAGAFDRCYDILTEGQRKQLTDRAVIGGD